jgi:hypothetical protein
MKTTLISLSLSLGLVLLAGCASQKGAEGGGPSMPGTIPLLFSPPQQSYSELGAVSTLKSQPTPGVTWQRMLQRQAAAMGADAVLVDTSTLNNANTPMVNGTAISFSQPQTLH